MSSSEADRTATNSARDEMNKLLRLPTALVPSYHRRQTLSVRSPNGGPAISTEATLQTRERSTTEAIVTIKYEDSTGFVLDAQENRPHGYFFIVSGTTSLVVHYLII